MVQVKTGSWAELGDDAQKHPHAKSSSRSSAFPPTWNGTRPTPTAVHAVAYNRLGQPVATGRLLQPRPGVAKIGRMAVHQVLRGCGRRPAGA